MDTHAEKISPLIELIKQDPDLKKLRRSDLTKLNEALIVIYNTYETVADALDSVNAIKPSNFTKKSLPVTEKEILQFCSLLKCLNSPRFTQAAEALLELPNILQQEFILSRELPTRTALQANTTASVFDEFKKLGVKDEVAFELAGVTTSFWESGILTDGDDLTKLYSRAKKRVCASRAKRDFTILTKETVRVLALYTKINWPKTGKTKSKKVPAFPLP